MINWEMVTDWFSSHYSSFGFQDVVDILIVSFIVYEVILFIRKSRAAQILKGILLLVVLLELAQALDLTATTFLLSNSMQLGVVAVIVVFQPELRSALEQVGRRTIGIDFFSDREQGEELRACIHEVSTACESMAKQKTGALIVFERTTGLREIISSGVALDATVSAELIESIFFVNNPLHDGAVIIRNNRIYAASCLLPLTQNRNLSKELGTRHRAAVGLSEVSDALVVVVSEETGKISLVSDGLIRRGYRADTLQEALLSGFEQTAAQRPSFFKRLFEKGGVK